MLIVLFPFFWAINIVTNAFAYLRILEGSGGYVLLTAQITAYQWGWKYCYGDTFYPKILSNSVNVGLNSSISAGSPNYTIDRDPEWKASRPHVAHKYPFMTRRFSNNDEITYFVRKIDEQQTLALRRDWNVTMRDNQDLQSEVYFCRWWLKQMGVLENERNKPVKNKLYHTGFWISAQGVDPNAALWEYNDSGDKKLVQDPMRLLRSTGALVLPTRSNIRLMGSSEDITHSWAVPGLGIKMDCVPGRLFCIFTNITREGVYFGQCSELCGWNHYNMPVIVYALPIEHFIIWWEIELHSIFAQSLDNYSAKFPEKDVSIINYRLINYKYK